MPQIEVHFSGRVQGVGFRYTTSQIASRFAVTGFVQNLSDGRVRMVAQGDSRELDSFLDAIKERMSSNIRDVAIERQTSDSHFDGFVIKR